jgi:hypothetical protein
MQPSFLGWIESLLIIILGQHFSVFFRHTDFQHPTLLVVSVRICTFYKYPLSISVDIPTPTHESTPSISSVGPPIYIYVSVSRKWILFFNRQLQI